MDAGERRLHHGFVLKNACAVVTKSHPHIKNMQSVNTTSRGVRWRLSLTSQGLLAVKSHGLQVVRVAYVESFPDLTQ